MKRNRTEKSEKEKPSSGENAPLAKESIDITSCRQECFETDGRTQTFVSEADRGRRGGCRWEEGPHDVLAYRPCKQPVPRWVQDIRDAVESPLRRAGVLMNCVGQVTFPRVNCVADLDWRPSRSS